MVAAGGVAVAVGAVDVAVGVGVGPVGVAVGVSVGVVVVGVGVGVSVAAAPVTVTVPFYADAGISVPEASESSTDVKTTLAVPAFVPRKVMVASVPLPLTGLCGAI